MQLQIDKPLVSAEWLNANFDADNLLILDATIPKVTVNKTLEAAERNQITGAIFFDIKKTFSEPAAPFSNTILSPEKFEDAAQKLGVNSTSCIVVYDDHGIYSSARAWWLFKAMGFKNVAVLNGGLPAWKKAGFLTELKKQNKLSKGNFKADYQQTKIKNYHQVLKTIQTDKELVLDARSSARFYATASEPRAEIRSGHIPTSKNLPFSTLLEADKLKSATDLKTIFEELNKENKPMIFSCGSGITACVLALGAEVAGFKSQAVYDGSWTEWGSLPELPIEV